jgi:EAL domain-containing protein (putative c-di-GMP-specific phosphodiesterase class I)
VNIETNDIIGAEALIRWQHPDRGLLMPGDFLPAINDHSLSIQLGEWVISTALKQLADWQASGLDMTVSVNIGALQLQQENFLHQLQLLLDTYPQVRHEQLELEVLETNALQDIEKVSKLITECRNLGVRFALDDFGTGYSSLTYLKHLPAYALKIDRSFVRDMLDDPDDLAIVQGVIGLAKAFHREVIAEGVETAEHRSLLLSMGCKLAQGYGIAKPAPADDLPAWIENWKQLAQQEADAIG